MMFALGWSQKNLLGSEIDGAISTASAQIPTENIFDVWNTGLDTGRSRSGHLTSQLIQARRD
jgi:hypothetical protein